MQLTMTLTFDDVGEASLFMARLSTAFEGMAGVIKNTARAAAAAVLAPNPNDWQAMPSKPTAVEPILPPDHPIAPALKEPIADPTTLGRSYLAKLGDKVGAPEAPQVEATTSVPSTGDAPKRRGRKPRYDEPVGYVPKETAAPVAAEVPATAKKVSVDDLRLLANQIVKKHGPQTVYGILQKFGAARLPDLAEDKIPVVHSEMTKLLIDDVVPF